MVQVSASKSGMRAIDNTENSAYKQVTMLGFEYAL